MACPTRDQACPFLNIPLELRNQIYGELLLFDKGPVPDPPHEADYWEELDWPTLDVSILRVNKQIHEEASSILYGQNVFPIRFTVLGSEDLLKEPYESQPHIDVTYRTFWETAQYQRYFDSKKVGYHSNTSHGYRPFTRVTEDEILKLPSQGYRHLVRYFKIAIVDLHVTAFNGDPGLPIDDVGRKWFKSILMSFVRGRLKTIVSDTSKVQFDIVMIPIFLHPTSHQNALERRLTEKEVDALDPIHLKKLAYTAWPLTMIAGKYNLKLLHPAERRFKTMKDDALEECNKDPSFTAEEEDMFAQMNLDKNYSWAVENGRLILVSEWDKYPQDDFVTCSF